MNANFTLSAALFLTGLSSVAGAADMPAVPPEPQAVLWKASLGEDTEVAISTSSIVSVAIHPYLLNGITRVTQVTVDTLGNNTIRFYYIHPELPKSGSAAPKEALREVKRHLAPGEEALPPSVKFPEGVYAHSVEYQLDSLDALEKLHKSLLAAWEKAGRRVTSFKLP